MNIKKFPLWFYMFLKRLLCKPGFVAILCAIPLLVWGANLAMQGENGILTVYLCCEDGNSDALEVIDNIKNTKTSLLFKESTNLDESLNALEQKKADAVWYFKNNFSQKAASYAGGKNKKPLVEVFQREDNIPLKLSRERLYAGVYSKLAYGAYKNFVYTEFTNVSSVSEDVIKSYVGKRDFDGEIVTMETLEQKSKKSELSYLVMPVRGILAILVMLCGFASALVFINDKKYGRFDWMPKQKQIIPCFAQCLAGISLSALSVFAALHLSQISVGFFKELVSMILFIIASTGFCLVFGLLFKSVSKAGALIPAFIILMLVFSPVFFDLNILNGIKYMLPTHYYLFYVHNSSYLKEFVCYIPCVYSVAWLIGCRGKTF